MPADYRKAPSNVLGGIMSANQAANLTRYYFGIGYNVGVAAVVGTQLTIAELCTIDNLYIESTAAPGVGEQIEVTLMLAGAPTTLQATILGALTQADDLVNRVAIPQGGQIAIRVVTSLAAAATNTRWGFRVTT